MFDIQRFSEEPAFGLLSREDKIRIDESVTKAEVSENYVEKTLFASTFYANLIGTNSLDRTFNDANDTSVALKDTMFISLNKNDDDTITWSDLYSDGTSKMTDIAFAFTLNDGVNGVMISDNSREVKATANADVVTGKSYEVEITETAKPAETTVTLSDINNSTRIITRLIERANEQRNLNDALTLSNIRSEFEKALFEVGAVLKDNAITLSFGDGDDYYDVNFTYEELLDPAFKFSDANAKITNTLDATNLRVTFEDDWDGLQIHMLNQKAGENSEISFHFSWDMSSGEVGNYLQSFMNPLQKYNWLNINGSNAKGTIAELNESGVQTGTSSTLQFNANNFAFYNEMAIKAIAETETPVKITTVKPIEVAVTYQQLLEGYSFSDLASDINSAGTNVKAVYDPVQDKFSFYNKESGEIHGIGFNFTKENKKVSDRTTNFFNRLGLKESKDGELIDQVVVNNGEALTAQGKNAATVGLVTESIRDKIEASISQTKAAALFLGKGDKASRASNADTADVATKATKDSAGNVISDTYVTQSLLSDTYVTKNAAICGGVMSDTGVVLLNGLGVPVFTIPIMSISKKKFPQLSVSPNPAEISAGSNATTAGTISRLGDGALSAECNTDNLETVEVDGTTVRYTTRYATAVGTEAEITITVAETDEYASESVVWKVVTVQETSNPDHPSTPNNPENPEIEEPPVAEP